jgi:hypothetical protein
MKRQTKRNNKKNNHNRIKHHRGGDNSELSVAEINDKFELVKQKYGDVADNFLDSNGEYGQFKEYMEDCCDYNGTLPRNSFFIGKTNDNKTVVLISKNADKELLDALNKLPQPLKVYNFNDDIKFSVTESWDHAGNTGYVSKKDISIEGETKIGHLKYDIDFILNGDFYTQKQPTQNRRGSWDDGAGIIQYRPEQDYEYRKRQKKALPTAILSLQEKGLVPDTIRIIGEKVLEGYGKPKRFDDVIVSSELYTPKGDFKEIFEISEDTQAQVDEAEERFNIHQTELGEEMKRDEKLRQSMMNPWHEQEYGDYRYGYNDDDRYYGGVRNKHRASRKTKRTHKRSKKTNKKSRSNKLTRSNVKKTRRN